MAKINEPLDDYPVFRRLSESDAELIRQAKDGGVVEITVKPDELGWMLAQGWTLVDEESRFRTENGDYRIAKENTDETT